MQYKDIQKRDEEILQLYQKSGLSMAKIVDVGTSRRKNKPRGIRYKIFVECFIGLNCYKSIKERVRSQINLQL